MLVLGDKIVHVGLGLGELHLVHALARVPVQECLPAEHGREPVGDAPEHALDGRRVADERGADVLRVGPLGRDVAHAALDVVRNPVRGGAASAGCEADEFGGGLSGATPREPPAPALTRGRIMAN